MSILIRGGLVLAEAGVEPVAADVLVEGDRVARVGPGLEASPDATVLDAREHLVLPGLVNAHTHVHNWHSRGAIDGVPLEVWLQRLVPRALVNTPRDLYVGAALGAIEAVKTGTTCVCDMAQVFPWPTPETLDAVAQAYADVGVRASIAAQVFDLGFLQGLVGLEARLTEELRAEIAARPPIRGEEVLATMRGAVERWHGAAEGRIRFGAGPNNVTLCSDGFAEACAALAAERGLTVQTHLCETKAGALTALERYGKSATAKLRDLGLLGPRTILAHAVWVDDADIELIAESGSWVAHNPVSNLKLGSGIAPVLKMRDRGCSIALGTDGSASSDNQNMFGPMRLAAILHRVVDPNYERWLSAAEVVRMATADGARAAGFGEQTGSIALGRKADLALVDLRDTSYHPRNDVVSQLVHCDVGGSVSTVLVDGRIVVRDGRVTTVDEEALLAEADEIGRRTLRDMEGPMGFARRVEPYVRQTWLAATRAEWSVNRYASEAARELPTG